MNRKTTTNGKKTVTAAGLALVLLLVADATVMTDGPARAWGNGHLSAQAVDDEEKAFLAARSLINRTRFSEAAGEFRQLRGKYPKGKYVSDSFYWEAFARHRLGQLEQAHLLLDNMLESIHHRGTPRDPLVARRINDARQLRLRILGEMAERGDSRAAAEVLRRSEFAMGQAWDSIAMSWDSIATGMATGMDSLAAIMIPGMVGMADSLQWAIGREEDWEQLRRGMQQLEIRLEDWGLGLQFSVSRERQLPEGCEDESVQQEALTAILRLDETNRIQILRSVIDRDDECSSNLRVYAIDRLAREGTADAERELINVAATHPDPEARRAAVSGLRRFDTPTAVAALVAVLARSADAATQEAAIQGLRRSGHAGARDALAVFAADASKSEDLREDAIVALGRRDDVETEVLTRLYSALITKKLKGAIIGRLRRIAESGNEEAATWLFNRVFDASESADIRSQALDAWARSPSLELSGLDQAYRRLGEPDLRERIFYALYRKAGRSEGENEAAVVRKMVELARIETDPEVRERAVYWLGRTGSAEAVEFLLELLRGPSRDTVPKTGKSGKSK